MYETLSANFWWILAGLALLIELITFTFYFAALAVVFAIAAIIAIFTNSIIIQIAITILLSFLGFIAIRNYRQRNFKTNSNDFFSDIGHRVKVENWNGNQTEVTYRGAKWTAFAANDKTKLESGTFIIKQVKGSSLLIDNLP